MDASLLNTQHYKVRIKCKGANLGIVTIEKGVFESPSTTVGQPTYLYQLNLKYDIYV